MKKRASDYGVSVTYRPWGDLPRGILDVADRRMDGFVRAFGRQMQHGGTMTMLQFAVSCYLQGCEDMALAVIGQETRSTLDFQI